MFKKSFLFASSVFSIFLAVQIDANANSSLGQAPTIVVKKNQQTGLYEIPENFPGSATYISPQDIEEKQTMDINRIIRDIPGVNVQEEDGYGLRPNIGIRGSRNDRSADIALMEDGVPIVPAPYSAPSAYYFPSSGRIKGIEVRKGSSAIKYGPRTTSGAINLITTPIPDFSQGSFVGSIGSNQEQNFNFNYGNSFNNFGYLINVDHQTSDGFKELDGGGDTGHELSDFMTKLRFNSDKDAEIYQAVELKIAFNDEDSNETYTGVTLADFVSDPYRRYKASALDNMGATHKQYEIKHFIEPSDNTDITSTFYYHEFARNWYKLDKVDGTSISSIFDDISTYASNLSIMKGESDGSFTVKANNRDYVSQGIQSVANSTIDSEKIKHNLEYGFRYHADYEDRMQHSDTYNMTSGEISFASTNGEGASGNRINSTRALSFFAEDEMNFGKLIVAPGVRFEHIELKRKNYDGNNDVARTNATTTKTSEDVVVPGIAASYELAKNINVFGGVHKGFAPPSPGSSASAEESVNYEAGLRFRNNNSFFESVLFFNDYDNLLGTDTASGSSSGTGDQYNGGEVDAYGLEVSAGHRFEKDLLGKSFKLPVKLGYTYNRAEFKNSFTENGISEWGDVESGDELPYIARHQVSVGVGLDFAKLSLNLSNKFVSAMRNSAGSGTIVKTDKIPSHFITDFAGFYEVKPDQNIFLAVDNIFDKAYAASLRPAGLRPGKPLTVRAGIKVNF